MPQVSLPSSAQGWVIVLLASFVGFVAGFLTILLAGRFGGG
jgi:hypothetical protein